jgi:predicted aconitase
VVILFLLARQHPSRYTHGDDIYWVFAGYVVAKLLETFDKPLYEFGHFASGHSLKHLAAAVAGLLVCRMLYLRTLQPQGSTVASGAPGLDGASISRS